MAEWLEEKAKREAKEAALRQPPRLNAEGVPMYMTISNHKFEWEKKMKEEREKVVKHEEHCRRIGQDRDSLTRVTKADGKRYVYDYRGFLVEEHVHEEAEEKKRRDEEAAALKRKMNSKEVKIRRAAQAKPFNGVILEKTHKHVQNMRRLVKFRYEHATWYADLLPATTYNLCDSVTNASKMLMAATSKSVEALIGDGLYDVEDEEEQKSKNSKGHQEGQRRRIKSSKSDRLGRSRSTSSGG